MTPDYTLGLFANMYPAYEGDSYGVFIKRMVDSLENKGIKIEKAVKTNKGIIYYPKFIFDSIKLSRHNSPDLLQAEYIPHSSIIPAILKKDKPLILKFHGDDGRIFPFKNSFNKRITQLMIKKSSHVITVSEELKARIIELGTPENKISVIGCGVDTQFFKNIDLERIPQKFVFKNTGKLNVLFVGRLHSDKGIHEIIETAKKRTDYNFILAGPGKIPHHPSNCHFLGNVNSLDMPYLMSGVDCLLLPSYTEGLPNVLLESLACKTPVIASDVGGCSEIVDNYKSGFLIRPHSVEDILYNLDWMLSHTEEREKMGEFGRRKMVEKYENEILIDKLIKLHKTIIESSNI